MKQLSQNFLALFFLTLYSITAQEGSILWSTPSIGDNLEAMPAVDALGNVYILAGNKLYSYTSSGVQRWGGPKEAIGGDANSVSISQNDTTVYVPGIDGIRAFNTSDGSLLWSSKTFFTEAFGSVVCESKDGTTLYIGSGADYIGSQTEYIYAINANTGDYYWRKAVDFSAWPACCRGFMAGCSIDRLGNVYLPGQDGILYSFRDDSTAYIQNWTFNLGAESRMPVTIDNTNDFIYASSNTSVVYKLNTSGSVLKSKNVAAGQEIFAALVLSPDGQTLYVNAEDSKLHALTTSNFTEKWAYTFQAWGSDPLVRDDGVVLVMGQLNGAGRVCAIRDDGTTGTLLWSSPKIMNNLTLNESNVNIGPEGNIYIHSGDQPPLALFAIRGNRKGLSTLSPWPKAMGNIKNNGASKSNQDIDPVDSTDPNCPAIVDTNDFESGWGIWNDGGSDARRSIQDAAYSNGNYAIRLRDNSSTSKMTTDLLDFSKSSQIQVEFSFYARSMENNENFWLQISTNGGTSYTTVKNWSKGKDFANNTRYNDNIVPIYGPFTAATKLRFRCDASNNHDYIYIDDVEIKDSSACSPIINRNDFESRWGIWNDGGSDARRSRRDAAYSNGNYAIRLRDDSSSSKITTDLLDFSKYSQIEVEFSFYARSMENNEDFWLQISTNGGASYTTIKDWSKGKDFVNNTRYNDNVVTINGPFTAATKLRFRCDASSNRDYIYIDDVEIRDSSGQPTEQYTITNSATNGNISLNPASPTYTAGSTVTVTAIPDANYQFDNWSGDVTGTTNPLDITMTGNKSIIANFSPINGTWNKIDDQNPGVSYTDYWNNIEGPDYYLNTAKFKEGIGGTASYTFTGSRAKIFILRITEFATTIEVTLDGVSQGQFSLAPGSEDIVEIYDSGKLSNGSHTISFTNTSPELSFDYFEFFTPTTVVASENKRIDVEYKAAAVQSFTANVYPNPVVEKMLQIMVNGINTQANISIFDIHAKMLISRPLQVQASKTVKIGLQNLDPGLYFVKITSAQHGSITKKIILK